MDAMQYHEMEVEKRTILITVNGTIIESKIEKYPDYTEIQRAVEGYIQLVPNFDCYDTDPCHVWCNEEGKITGQSHNALATMLWGEYLTKNFNHREINWSMVDLTGPIFIVVGPTSFLAEQVE
jgi:hypothetical protein